MEMIFVGVECGMRPCYEMTTSARLLHNWDAYVNLISPSTPYTCILLSLRNIGISFTVAVSLTTHFCNKPAVMTMIVTISYWRESCYCYR